MVCGSEKRERERAQTQKATQSLTPAPPPPHLLNFTRWSSIRAAQIWLKLKAKQSGKKRSSSVSSAASAGGGTEDGEDVELPEGLEAFVVVDDDEFDEFDDDDDDEEEADDGTAEIFASGNALDVVAQSAKAEHSVEQLVLGLEEIGVSCLVHLHSD